MAFLEAQHIVKRYARHLALDDVSIAVPQGSVFGLMGPNGAGKTTLIRIINRITAPDSGEILFEGRRFAPTDVARIGYLPEERGLYRKMKVGEQAIYLARLKGIDKATARKRLTEWFEKFDIMPWWNRKVEELSKGMQQKIQFVCTVIHEPDLLIFDEPFSGFDPVNAELLKQEILTLRDQGRTIIFSTHNMQSVEEVCDECALFNKSHVVLQGNVSEVRQRFAQGIVSLEVETSAPLSQEQLSQLSVVDSNFYPGEKKQLLRLKMRAGEDLRDLVQTLPRELHLLSLREEIPSMNEIFIQTITQQQNHQEDHEKEQNCHRYRARVRDPSAQEVVLCHDHLDAHSFSSIPHRPHHHREDECLRNEDCRIGCNRFVCQSLREYKSLHLCPNSAIPRGTKGTGQG